MLSRLLLTTIFIVARFDCDIVILLLFKTLPSNDAIKATFFPLPEYHQHLIMANAIALCTGDLSHFLQIIQGAIYNFLASGELSTTLSRYKNAKIQKHKAKRYFQSSVQHITPKASFYFRFTHGSTHITNVKLTPMQQERPNVNNENKRTSILPLPSFDAP